MHYALIKEDNFRINLCKNHYDKNDFLMYSKHNEYKSVIAERVKY